MEKPQNMTPAEYNLYSYQDYLNEGGYSYIDMMVLADNIIRSFGYPPDVACDLHMSLFPDEELFDENKEAFEEISRSIPVELLTLMYPGVYKQVTDMCMDEALEIARGTISQHHDGCYCDQRIETGDPLHDPLPRCEEDECPVDELRKKLEHNLIDPEVLKFHKLLEENIGESLDYRIRLIYACQRAKLLTPGMTATMIQALYSNMLKATEQP